MGSYEGLYLGDGEPDVFRLSAPLPAGFWGGGISDSLPRWHKWGFSGNWAVSGCPWVSGVKKRQEQVVASARGCEDSKLNAVKFAILL